MAKATSHRGYIVVILRQSLLGGDKIIDCIVSNIMKANEYLDEKAQSGDGYKYWSERWVVR